MAELQPPYSIAFNETIDEVLTRLAEERGKTKKEILQSALQAHEEREKRYASGSRERGPTEPECEIGITESAIHYDY